MLDEILKSVDDKPKTVILILVGFIFIGSITGGLWINNLHDSLNQTRILAEDRLKVIEDINRNKLIESKLNLKLAANDVVDAELQVKDSLNALIVSLENTISTNTKLSEVDKQILISEIKQKLTKFKSSFGNQIDKAINPLLTGSSDVGSPNSLSERNIIYFLLVGLIIVIVLYFYHKNKKSK